MSRIVIDRLELSCVGLEQPAAQAVEAALPAAIRRQVQQRLSRRLSRSGAGAAHAQWGAVDLGTLCVGARPDPRLLADAIAARLSDWISDRIDSPLDARADGSPGRER